MLLEIEYASGNDTRIQTLATEALPETILAWSPIESVVSCMNTLEGASSFPRCRWSVGPDPEIDIPGEGRRTAMRLSIEPDTSPDRERIAMARWIFRDRELGDTALRPAVIDAIRGCGIDPDFVESLADLEPDGSLPEPWRSVDLAAGALASCFPGEPGLTLQLWQATAGRPRVDAVGQTARVFPRSARELVLVLDRLAAFAEQQQSPRIRRRWSFRERDGAVEVSVAGALARSTAAR